MNSVRLGGVHEVAEALGVSRQRVHQLAAHDAFPQPVAVLSAGSIWDLDAIDYWRNTMRPITAATPQVPDRDPDRPQDDPWDADAIRFLMRLTRRSRSWLMEHMRGQKRLDEARVDEARSLARLHKVEWRAHLDGTTVHFFRTDADAPLPYPASEAERRAWRARAS